MPKPRDLLYALVGLALLPFVLTGIGLGVTSATEVVIFAMACMALNILVGYTGLVSFGHGAWFGLAAYAAAIMHREYFAGHFLLPMAVGVGMVLLLSWASSASSSSACCCGASTRRTRHCRSCSPSASRW